MPLMEQIKYVALPHFVTTEQLSVEEVLALIDRAEYFKAGGTCLPLTQPVLVTNIFLENSSRTRTSFEVAERKLGLSVIPFDSEHSSAKKGETLYDTSLTMAALGIDLEVVRHPENEYYQELIHPKAHQHLDIGVVNGGDGSGQHPSQSMLDMMTIHEQFGHFDGLRVAIVGDIAHSRVAKSDMELLNRLGSKVYFSGPSYWYDKEFDTYGQYQELDQLLDQVDVIMLLRVQHERHGSDPNETAFDPVAYHARYGINQRRYDALSNQAIIMHPGPINRGVELADELVEAPKSTFVQQMHNGVFMRMAIIEAVMRGRALGGLS